MHQPAGTIGQLFLKYKGSRSTNRIDQNAISILKTDASSVEYNLYAKVPRYDPTLKILNTTPKLSRSYRLLERVSRER